jgi:hypothetical protein
MIDNPPGCGLPAHRPRDERAPHYGLQRQLAGAA